jgi:head-tail adaptor
LGANRADPEVASDTANILLKYQSDIAKAVREFAADKQGMKAFAPGPK